MVGLKVHGLLGNHMFQYAGLYALGKRLNTSIFVKYGKVRMNVPRLHKYFDIDGFNYFVNKYRAWRYSKTLESIELPNHSTPRENLINMSDQKMISGYLQSEQYFEDSKHDLSRIFTIKRKLKTNFDRTYKDLFSRHKTIAVHIRRTSYENFGGENLGGKNLTLPISYYQNCLSLIDDLNQYKIIFLSDDIESTKNDFGYETNFMFSEDSEINDFQILMNADIIITANSSFSWWGAYLNHKVDKVIYGPKYWLGFKVNKEYPVGIMTKNWNWVDVFN